jgi:hypothetical protein
VTVLLDLQGMLADAGENGARASHLSVTGCRGTSRLSVTACRHTSSVSVTVCE